MCHFLLCFFFPFAIKHFTVILNIILWHFLSLQVDRDQSVRHNLCASRSFTIKTKPVPVAFFRMENASNALFCWHITTDIEDFKTILCRSFFFSLVNGKHKISTLKRKTKQKKAIQYPSHRPNKHLKNKWKRQSEKKSPSFYMKHKHTFQLHIFYIIHPSNATLNEIHVMPFILHHPFQMTFTIWNK